MFAHFPCPFVIEFSLIKTLFIAAQKKAPYFINSPHNSFAPFTYINCHKMIEFESRCTPANPILKIPALKIGKVLQSTNLIYLCKVWLESLTWTGIPKILGFFCNIYVFATSILAFYFSELRKGFLFNVANAHIHFLFSGGVED